MHRHLRALPAPTWRSVVPTRTMTWDTECATDAQVRADSVACAMCCSVIFACTDATERKNHTLNMKRKDGEALSDPKAAVTKGTALAV